MSLSEHAWTGSSLRRQEGRQQSEKSVTSAQTEARTNIRLTAERGWKSGETADALGKANGANAPKEVSSSQLRARLRRGPDDSGRPHPAVEEEQSHPLPPSLEGTQNEPQKPRPAPRPAPGLGSLSSDGRALASRAVQTTAHCAGPAAEESRAFRGIPSRRPRRAVDGQEAAASSAGAHLGKLLQTVRAPQGRARSAGHTEAAL